MKEEPKPTIGEIEYNKLRDILDPDQHKTLLGLHRIISFRDATIQKLEEQLAAEQARLIAVKWTRQWGDIMCNGKLVAAGLSVDQAELIIAAHNGDSKK